MDIDIGVQCGKCGGEIYMYSCPKHHWTIFSKCLSCNKIHMVSDKCKECEFPFNKTWDGQIWRKGK